MIIPHEVESIPESYEYNLGIEKSIEDQTKLKVTTYLQINRTETIQSSVHDSHRIGTY